MFKTFRRSLLIAAVGIFAVGAFSQVTLNGGNISFGTTMAHASGSSCSVAMAVSDTVSDTLPNVGETITYTLNGSSALTTSTTITVNDQLGTGLTFVSANPSVGTYSSSTGVWNIGTLNGTANVNLTITATVDASAAGKTIGNQPTIYFVQSNCTKSQAATGVSILVLGSFISTPTSTPTSTTQYADLSISKTADVTSTVQGGTVDYSINVTNNGPATSTDVVATDTLPSGLSFVNATASEGSYASSTGTWTIGSLGANSAATLQVAATVTAPAGTTVVNTAVVGASTSTIDNNPGNNSSSVSVVVTSSTPAPCSLSAAQFEAAVASGTISWSPIATTTNTASFTIVNHTSCSAPISLASWQMFVPQGSSNWLSSQQRFGVASTSLAASSTQTLTVPLPSCMAQVDAYYGNAPTALLESNPYNYPNVPFNLAYTFANTNLPFCGVSPSADLSVTKTANVTSTTEGGTIDYTIAVTDLGPATSTGVVATDTLPSGLSFVSATTSEGSYASSTGTWTIGTLSASSTATLQIAATANTGTAGTTITNTATVGGSASTTDNNLANNSSSVSVVVAPIGTCTGSTVSASSSVSAGSASASASATSGCCPANASSSSSNGNSSASSSASTGGSCSSPIADLSVAKTVDNTTPSAGSTVNYTVSVTDLGPATSTGVVATDTLPSGLTFENATASVGSYASSTGTWTIGTLSASSTATLNIAALVNAGQNTGTSITNTATVGESTSTIDNNLANNSSSVTITVQNGGGGTPTSTPTSTPNANLSITKTVDNSAPNPGQTINYTLVVDAQGPATSTGVVATDTLPSGLTFENATASVGSYASSTGTWTIGTLTPSSTATLNIAALVDASDTVGQQITNVGIVGESTSTTNTGGNSSSSVTVTVTSPVCTVNCGGGAGNDAELSIAKTADVSSTLPGGTINYTITATAGGPQSSTGVVATDTLPSGLTFENATASVGSYASSTGTWTIGTLAPNATATLEIAALVNASGTANTTITNQATIGESPTLTNPSGNTMAQASVMVGTPTSTNEADLAIVKTVDNANPVTGSDVNFTVVVTNNGPDTAPDVVAEDQVPIGLATISATTTPSTTFNMGTGEWDIGTLAPNATATLTLEAEVSAAAGTSVTNTATVSSTLGSLIDPNPANNSSSVTLNVQSSGGGGGCGSNCGGGGGNTPSAQLAIVKTVDNSDPATGAVINYTLTVSAEGPSESFGVVASDTLPAGITFDSASSSEGSYNDSTGIWTIGQMADGQSATLVITATVTAPDGTSITNTGTVSESAAAQSPLTGPMTSSVTITVGGSGGNGGGGGGGGGTVGVGGGGGGGGQVLGASTSTGQVLGASCGLYLTQYIHPIRKDLNDPTEVDKLQVFLNQNLGLDIPVTGYYGDQTIAAVNQFQVKYHIEVLQPWVPLGLPTQFTPTSYVYQTTQRWINLIMCPPLNLPLPALKVDTGE